MGVTLAARPQSNETTLNRRADLPTKHLDREGTAPPMAGQPQLACTIPLSEPDVRLSSHPLPKRAEVVVRAGAITVVRRQGRGARQGIAEAAG